MFSNFSIPSIKNFLGSKDPTPPAIIIFGDIKILFFEVFYILKGYKGNNYSFSKKEKIADNIPCPYLFLNEISISSPKKFLEIGIFQGVTARNVCELLHKIHKDNFKYIGIDIFEEDEKSKEEVIPNVNFKNPFRTFL